MTSASEKIKADVSAARVAQTDSEMTDSIVQMATDIVRVREDAPAVRLPLMRDFVTQLAILSDSKPCVLELVISYLKRMRN